MARISNSMCFRLQIYGKTFCQSNIHKPGPLLVNQLYTSTRKNHTLILTGKQNKPLLIPNLPTIRVTVGKSTAEKYPAKDPVKGNLVYIGALNDKVKLVKAFSLSTSLFGVAMQPFLYQNAHQYPLWLQAMVGGMVNFFIFLTPVLLHFITKRYVVNMYYDNATGQFTATTYTFFLRKNEKKFTPDDVQVPNLPGVFTTVIAKGDPLFVDASNFLTREAYIKFMSYDKPLDWQLPPDEGYNPDEEKKQ